VRYKQGRYKQEETGLNKCVQKDPVAASFFLASWVRARSGAEIRDKKHLQARAKTPCYREDSELFSWGTVLMKRKKKDEDGINCC
jgi:hypothetical protein